MNDEKLSIGRVSAMVQLPASVLRYWETVFEQLKPLKTPGGTRKYTMQDVEVILQIKDLLYNRRYTIAGAKSALQTNTAPGVELEKSNLPEFITRELESIIAEISPPENKKSGKKHRPD